MQAHFLAGLFAIVGLSCAQKGPIPAPVPADIVTATLNFVTATPRPTPLPKLRSDHVRIEMRTEQRQVLIVDVPKFPRGLEVAYSDGTSFHPSTVRLHARGLRPTSQSHPPVGKCPGLRQSP